MERSIRSTKPLTKLAAIDCKPKPNPRPMAPVSTVKAVRSTPAAFKPMRMLSPIKKALANLARPMRVEGSSLLSFFKRRSIQRLIHAAASTNSVSVNSSFNTDHTRDAALAGRDADAVEAGDDRIEPAEVFGGNHQPDDQREAIFKMLHPRLIAETGREQQHAEAHDDVRADQAHGRIQNRDIVVRRIEQPASQDHQP